MKKNNFSSLKIGSLLLLSIVTSCSSIIGSTTVPKIMTSSISGLTVYSAIVSHEPFVTQIFLRDLDTGIETKLTNSGNNGFPKWSPDGSMIVFASWTKENSYDIFLMNNDGGNPQPIIAGPASELMAEWSPDGTKISYVSDENGSNEIYVIDLKAQTTTKLTNLQFTAQPAWSSDGKRIAFISNTGVSGRSQVFVMNADGTNIEQLTEYSLDNFDGNPIWCPDDSCIIFTRYLEGVPKLMYFNIQNKEASPMLNGVFDSNLPETNLSLSPSSDYMTFSVGGVFYAMNLKSREIFPLGIEALDLSLYP